MTDRELLELAAKAAGLTYRDDLWNAGHARNPDGLWVAWNPLTDDGDALRLAVRLGLGDGRAFVIGVSGADRLSNAADSDPDLSGAEEPHGDDPYAATRRAIVQAAAEIGRDKESTIV